MKLKFEFSSDPRHINTEVMNYVTVINVITEMVYTIVICLFSVNWWLSLILCLSMPALNGSFARLSGLKNKPYFYISLTLSGPIVFAINYFSGPAAPGWLFGLTMIWGTILAVRNKRVHLALIIYTCIVTLAAMIVTGKSVEQVVAVQVVLVAMSLTLTRTFAYLTLQNQALNDSRMKVDSLLANILPLQIANRMKEGETKFADRIDAVTILFLDIVGFTNMADHMEPDRIVQILDTVFSRFDELADKHGLEKIKTIGDAYMVAGGIPEPLESHVESVATMALEARDALGEIDRQFGVSLSCRGGLHTGPVVSGVIGNRKFSYDLWGDTVNVASRMESQGEPDQIQCTAAVYERLKDEFRFEKRRVLEVKGKGAMDAYFLAGRKHPAKILAGGVAT